jgi:hypothetical protein
LPNLSPARFGGKPFALLWRGSRDGFGSSDGHSNTLTLIFDTGGTVFGRFTPVKWESPQWKAMHKSDPSLKSFLFTMPDPNKVPGRKFALKARMWNEALFCDSIYGPNFGDMLVSDTNNARPSKSTHWFVEG